MTMKNLFTAVPARPAALMLSQALQGWSGGEVAMESGTFKQPIFVRDDGFVLRKIECVMDAIEFLEERPVERRGLRHAGGAPGGTGRSHSLSSLRLVRTVGGPRPRATVLVATKSLP